MDKNNKKKKIKTIIITIIVIIIAIKGFSLYNAFMYIRAISSMTLQYGLKNYKKYNIKNFPNFAKNFRADDSLEMEWFSFYGQYIHSDNDPKHEERYKKALIKLEEEVPINLEEFKNILIPKITSMINSDKATSFPTFEDRKKIPANPKSKSLENTCKYWVYVSKYFEEKNDYESSILLRQGMFYLVRAHEVEFNENFYPLTELSISDIACESIRKWASEPKPQHKELSRKIAKDIFDLVKTEYSISQKIEYEKKYCNDCIEYCINLNSYYSSFLKSIKNSGRLKKITDLTYDEPLTYINNPYYEIKDKLEKFTEKERQNYWCIKDFKSKGIFDLNFFLYPEEMVDNYLTETYSFLLESDKQAYEQRLADMEMTAIALLINAYYCENNELPKNMKELSSWYGEELPKDRLTNKEYEINSEGFFTLFNHGICSLFPNYDFFTNREKKVKPKESDDLLDDQVEWYEMPNVFSFTFKPK